MSTILRTYKLTKKFNGVVAVDNVSISVRSNLITAIVGPNGSGKSTLVNLITGIIPFDSGEIVIEKHTRLKKIDTKEIASFGIVRTFQNVRLFEQMSVLDNILVALTERSLFDSIIERHTAYHIDIAKKILNKLGLWGKRHVYAEKLSFGQRKLLEIARVLAMGERTDGDVKILFFDEPYAGLFPEMVSIVSEVLKELRGKGKAIVLIEHNMNIIRELSDYVYVLDAGRVLREGGVEEVLSDPKVIEAYLG